MINKVSDIPTFVNQTQSKNNLDSNKNSVRTEGFYNTPGFNNYDIVDISAIKPIEQNQRGNKISEQLEDDGNKASTKEQGKLTDEEYKEVEELKRGDSEVRQHEQAHLASAGQYAKGGALYKFQVGPDGRRYAVGGEVSIDTAKVKDNPDATIAKAQTIRRSANAPAEPSSQDRQVAAQATQMEAQARAEKVEEPDNKNSNKEVPSTEEKGQSPPVNNSGTTDPVSKQSETTPVTSIYGQNKSVSKGILDVIA